MIDFNNKPFFKLKKNDEYASKVKFEFKGAVDIKQFSTMISEHIL